jgi:hypothetical protein
LKKGVIVSWSPVDTERPGDDPLHELVERKHDQRNEISGAEIHAAAPRMFPMFAVTRMFLTSGSERDVVRRLLAACTDAAL